MLKIMGVVDGKYTVHDTANGIEDLVSAEELVLHISNGVEFEGCKYGPKGLIVWYDGVNPYDVDVEVWKPVWFRRNGVVIYVNKCKVSNLGNLIQLCKIDGVEKWVSKAQATKKRGYKTTSMRIGGRQYSIVVHRLVAFAFVPNPNGYSDINHKDEVTSNNGAYNLEWCTRKYNNNYGSHPHNVSVSKSMAVRKYSLTGELVDEFPSCKAAALTSGCASSAISSACLGKNLSAAGFVWRYVASDELFAMSVSKRAEVCDVRRRSFVERDSVRQYDIYGNFINEFESVVEAVGITGEFSSAIHSSCKGAPGASICKGCVWRYSSDDMLAELPVLDRRNIILSVMSKKTMNMYRHVRQYSLDYVFVAEFSSVILASSETGCKKASIRACCNRVYQRGWNFVWRYADDDEFEDRSENRSLIEEFHRKQAEQG